MKNIITFLHDFNYVTICIRLVLAIVAGGIIGNERGKHGSAAGLRTHILVCIGATMTALTGYYIYDVVNISNDITSLAAQVVSGIGFLGAGMIIVKKRQRCNRSYHSRRYVGNGDYWHCTRLWFLQWRCTCYDYLFFYSRFFVKT